MNDWTWLGFDSTPVLLKKADRLFDQGARVQRMHIIVNGRVKLIRHPVDGEDVVLHVATAGEMIAEASFFSEVYHCSAIADLPSEIQCIDRDEALKKILSDAQTSRDVLHLFAQQIRDLRGLHELRNIRSAQSRILAYLATQADSTGKIIVNMSLRDMAYKLGLAHETLYRELRKLETSDQLERPASGEIILRNPV
jgi:CRP-like cAMP-binding protein